MKRVLLAIVLSLFALNSHAKYCGTKNWNTAKNYYSKYAKQYDEQVDKFNEILDTYNDFTFIKDAFSVDNMLEMWVWEETLTTQNIVLHKEMALAEIARLDKVRDKLGKIKSKLGSSKMLWEKLADYCYEEDKYKAYKAGRENMRASIKTIKALNELTSRIDKYRLKYLKDVGFINQTRDIHDASNDGAE